MVPCQYLCQSECSFLPFTSIPRLHCQARNASCCGARATLPPNIWRPWHLPKWPLTCTAPLVAAKLVDGRPAAAIQYQDLALVYDDYRWVGQRE